jgi:PAS domain S-box-containing protein
MKESAEAHTYQVILDSVADGVFTVDLDWRITSFNAAAERITGVQRAEALGRHCCDVFRASICETECALKGTHRTGRPVVNKAVYILRADGERIPISVSTAVLKDERGHVIGGVETFRDLSQVEELRKELEGRYTFADIVGRSAAMQRVFELLAQVADSASTVLIEGESGTGKELVARAIHNLSPRGKRRFVALNCGALPDTLLESELFGYKAGRSRMPSGTSRGGWRWLIAALSFSMKSATFRRRCRRGCCACCKSVSSSRSGRSSRCRWTCGSWPPRIVNWMNWCVLASSGRICTTASTLSACDCRRCVSGARTFRC